MSDASDDEREAIRERKKERLRSAQSGPTESADGPVHVDSEEQFREVTGGDGVVLVDFYADWCGPCKMLAPTVETIAESTSATVAKVDVDEHQALAREHEVQGVPTLLLFAGGEQVERLVGVQDRAAIERVIEQHG